MLKEIIICIIIIVSIFGLEIFTQNFTKKTVEEITNMFSVIDEAISKQNKEQMKKEIEKIYTKWDEKQEQLAYYIEHDELEKVHTSIVTMKSYVESENYSAAMAELAEGKFVLEHIQEKNSFNLRNLF